MFLPTKQYEMHNGIHGQWCCVVFCGCVCGPPHSLLYIVHFVENWCLGIYQQKRALTFRANQKWCVGANLPTFACVGNTSLTCQQLLQCIWLASKYCILVLVMTQFQHSRKKRHGVTGSTSTKQHPFCLWVWIFFSCIKKVRNWGQRYRYSKQFGTHQKLLR